jgi:Ca-activated chloride channel family protein
MALPFDYEERGDSTTLLRPPGYGGRALLRASRVGGAGPWRPSRESGAGPWGALTLGLAILAGDPGISAQFSSGVNLVEVYAAVTDQAGNPVAGLRRGDFTVLEDGQPQALSAFAEGDFPLSVAVAIDRSFSMGAKQLPTAVSAARTFLGELRAEDQSMIVGIGSEIEVLAPLSTDRGAQMPALSALKPWGTTGLHDAILQSIEAVQAAKGRRALVLLSDGSDRYSKATAADALDRARHADVMIYPVAIGSTRPPLFAELASLTGGRSFQPKTPADLNVIMRTIANELRHQYLLGYTPSRPIVRGDEQWRTIAVRVNRPGVTVRARDGYLAR